MARKALLSLFSTVKIMRSLRAGTPLCLRNSSFPANYCSPGKQNMPARTQTWPGPSLSTSLRCAAETLDVAFKHASSPIGAHSHGQLLLQVQASGSSKLKQSDGTANSTPKPKLIKTNHALPSVAQSPLDARPASITSDQQPALKSSGQQPAVSSAMSATAAAPSRSPSQSKSSQSLIAPSPKVQKQQKTAQILDPASKTASEAALRLAEGAQLSRPAASDISAEDGMILEVSQADSTAVSTAISVPVREPTELDEREHGRLLHLRLLPLELLHLTRSALCRC